MAQILEWIEAAGVSDLPAIANRNSFARSFADKPVDAILRAFMKVDQVAAIAHLGLAIRLAEDAGFPLAGQGVDAGAGTGIFCSVAVRLCPKIQRLYAVEIVPDLVRHVQPTVFRSLAGERADRLTGVIGSFDKFDLSDNSCDFCIEYDSFHHSDNLVASLRESARILKPGAPLIAVDRAHHNGLSDEQREFMLDVQYSAEWKKANAYPEAPLTRRENGEHEIRLAEWEAAFQDAGFRLARRHELRPLTLRSLRRKVKLTLPFALRRLLSMEPSYVRPQAGELPWMIRALLMGDASDQMYCEASHQNTLFILQKI